MAKKPDWEIPLLAQPKPEEFDFDLDRALQSVVGLHANIPEDAYTASILGTERAGSGVLIRDNGLVLTIGYLITEAESVWLSTADGRSSSVKAGDRVIRAAGGRRQSVRAGVIGTQEFAGYWEYLLEAAIFTAPAHPFWGGAGLIGRDGTLLGIGSLNVQQVVERDNPRDINMVVPIDILKPVLDELLAYGKRNKPARPWLGLYSAESDKKIVVAGLAERGPAAAAGMRVGDIIWAVRDGRTDWVRVKSIDRSTLLKAPRLQ